MNPSAEMTPILISMLILGGVTFAYRFSFISRWGSGLANKLPARLLELLGPAAFTAIIVNNLLSHQKHTELFQYKLVVAVLAGAVAYFTRSVLATLVFGLLLLHYLQSP